MSATRTMTVAAVALAALLAAERPAAAHCDTLDGPVVTDARDALAGGDVTPVLKWVRQADEAEIRASFAKAVAARGQGDAAREVADRWFFETLVRVHRAGEGAPYDGLKPAGTVEPGITAADQALATGTVDALADEVGAAVAADVRQRFARAHAAREKAGASVARGRDFVAAYVDFIHYVEKAHAIAAFPAAHGHEEPAAVHSH